MAKPNSETWHKEMFELREKRDVEGKKRWTDLINSIFPHGAIHKATWTQIDQIVTILNVIGGVDNCNHTFYPRGGGFDLTGSGRAAEVGCIELLGAGTTTIVKPGKLTFYAFGSDPQWYYFHLETETLNPSGVYESSNGKYEELCELYPGEYEERYVWDQGYFGEDDKGRELRLPAVARPVIREFNGSFVIFGKYTDYNKDTSTYDGRHNRGTTEAFSQYIRGYTDHHPLL